MQVWVSAENAPELHSAIKTDLRRLLINFVNEKSSDFKAFKSSWSALGMSRLQHLCPRAVTPPFFLQIIYQNVLDLLHDLPEGSFLPLEIPKCLQEILWNIGVFYTLHTLHYTRLIENSDTKIRISPLAWTELLVANERLALFPDCASQALRILRLLISNDVFQYAMLTGVPTLYRVKAFIKEISQDTTLEISKPSLSTCVANTKMIRDNIDTYVNVMVREVRHASVHATMSASSAPFSSSSSSTSRMSPELGSSTALQGDHEHGTVEDSSLLDFFNSQPSEVAMSSPLSSLPVSTSSSSSVSVMAALEALEASTNEVFNDATVNEQASTQLPKRSRKRKQADKGSADRITRAPASSRKKTMSFTGVKATKTTGKDSRRKSNNSQSEDLHSTAVVLESSGSRSTSSGGGNNFSATIGNAAVADAHGSSGSGAGSLLDMLAQLERDSEDVLKSKNS